MKHSTCCFTGHRRLPKDKLEDIQKRLDHEVDALIDQGVTDFISGGALGFDQIAAKLILKKKREGKPVRLVLALPCRDQDKHWSEAQRRAYRHLLNQADEVVCLSEGYYDGCMEKRNRWMVERSGVCVCALLYPRSGTAQTVRLARERGLRIINISV